MGKYNGAVVTTAGEGVIAQALRGTKLTWTKMRTSSVAVSASSIKGLTALTGVEQTANITNASVYSNSIVQVSARFSNTGIATAYLIRTVGIYGQLAGGSETLIAVMTAVTPDEMPVYDADAPSAFIFTNHLVVQDAASITMDVNDTGTATVADLELKVDKAGGDVSNTVAATATASSAAYPIPAAGDSIKVILGKIRKFFTDIKAAYTNVSVSGRKITFTTAAGGTKEITTQDTTYGVVSKTANGLAPRLPNETTTTKYLRQDGSWQVPPNTTYGLASTSANGLLRQLNNSTANYMRGDGTWQTPPNTWRPVQNNLTSTSTTDCLSAYQGKVLNTNKQNAIKIAEKTETLTVGSKTTRDYTFSPTMLGITGSVTILTTDVFVMGAAYNNYFVNCDTYLNGAGVKVYIYNALSASANIPIRVRVTYY